MTNSISSFMRPLFQKGFLSLFVVCMRCIDFSDSIGSDSGTASSSRASYATSKAASSSSIFWQFRAPSHGAFGTSIAASREHGTQNLAVVGAPHDSAELVGGSVYVFELVDGSSEHEHILYSPNADSGDQFGFSVDTSEDIIVVGAPYEDGQQSTSSQASSDNSAVNAGVIVLMVGSTRLTLVDTGAAYVFVRDQTLGWKFKVYLKGKSDITFSHPDYDCITGTVPLAGSSFGAAVSLE